MVTWEDIKKIPVRGRNKETVLKEIKLLLIDAVSEIIKKTKTKKTRQMYRFLQQHIPTQVIFTPKAIINKTNGEKTKAYGCAYIKYDALGNFTPTIKIYEGIFFDNQNNQIKIEGLITLLHELGHIAAHEIAKKYVNESIEKLKKKQNLTEEEFRQEIILIKDGFDNIINSERIADFFMHKIALHLGVPKTNLLKRYAFRADIIVKEAGTIAFEKEIKKILPEQYKKYWDRYQKDKKEVEAKGSFARVSMAKLTDKQIKYITKSSKRFNREIDKLNLPKTIRRDVKTKYKKERIQNHLLLNTLKVMVNKQEDRKQKQGFWHKLFRRK